MSTHVLVIGGGGREHAITWKLSQSCKIAKVSVAPGSYAIGQLPRTENVNLDIKNFEVVASWCKNNKVEMVIIGPEDPLANGIADVLLKHEILVFGPERAAAQIESNKDWAKAFMDKYKVPTARWKAFNNAEEAKQFINTAPFPALVVKASGLAAGKGVVVAASRQEACAAVDEMLTGRKFGNASDTLVIEELLQGEELSVLAFTDGKTITAMLPAQDHKRIFNNDQGPNTGGMGAYCPCPILSSKELKFVQENILERTINGMLVEKIKFVGVLYAGLMMTKEGPSVLEFNCRFGDPETEVILPLLDSDLYDVMHSCCTNRLHSMELKWKKNLAAVGVVMASRGYPETSSKGQIISNIETVNQLADHVVFHCGTSLKHNNVVTNGGRVLIAVALAPQLTIAAAKATTACTIIRFDGEQHRTDIAHKGIARSILQSGKLTYRQSGVDITAGNDLIDHIKPCAKSTNRSGVMGGLGGFGGLFDTKLAGFKDPLLVSGTDGVGTKLKIAQDLGIHDTIGIDLVAMCVNDVLAHGAEPLFFLDYFACGALDVHVAKQVVSGVAEGCRQAGCALVGGETAEMPGMYPVGEYDIAGFAVGAVERDQLMPHIDKIQASDTVIALPSSGVHSNGFSMVRKVMSLVGASYKDKAPFSKVGKSFGEEFLTPTQLYIKAVIPAVKTGKVKAFAHITGGGLTENIPRVLTKKLGVHLDAYKWNILPVFAWLSIAGGINKSEMLRTFNCGVGGIVIVSKSNEMEILQLLRPFGASVIGSVFERATDIPDVIVDNFIEAMEPLMKPYVCDVVKQHSQRKKRVAVLISGSGTNLQALIDATQDPSQHMNAEISLVISNKEGVEGLKRAERAGIATKVIKHNDYSSREEFDMAIQAELETNNIEFVCLAGFMRILSDKFTKIWHGKMINVHPALLPLFKGTNGAMQALDAGVRVTGCSVHYVVADIDAGAIIVQEVVPIEIGDTEETLLKRLHPAEHRAYVKALRLIATGKAELGPDNKINWLH